VIEAIFKKLYETTKADLFLKKNRCCNIDDIKQQASLKILEKGNEFIIELEKNNKLEAYFFLVCLNLFRDEIKALKYEVDINTLDVEQNGEYEEISIDFDRLEKDYWYKAKVAQQVTDVNIATITKLSDKTDIPYYSLRRTFELTKKIIKENGEKYLKRTIITSADLD
jgi:hypothetical protein